MLANRTETEMARDIPFDAGRIEAEENLLIDYQFLIQELMTAKGISRAKLAELTGLSVARLSQVMGPSANPTVKTLARIVHALGETVSVGTVNKLAKEHCDVLAAAPVQWQWFDELATPASRQDVDMVSVVKRSFAGYHNDNRNVIVMEEEFEVAA